MQIKPKKILLILICKTKTRHQREGLAAAIKEGKIEEVEVVNAIYRIINGERTPPDIIEYNFSRADSVSQDSELSKPITLPVGNYSVNGVNFDAPTEKTNDSFYLTGNQNTSNGKCVVQNGAITVPESGSCNLNFIFIVGALTPVRINGHQLLYIHRYCMVAT